MNATCETCRFWQFEYGTPIGDCRAKPPKWSPDYPRGQWPATHEDEWCGEHQPRQQTDQGG
jgi:hypothetical protein